MPNSNRLPMIKKAGMKRIFSISIDPATAHPNKDGAIPHLDYDVEIPDGYSTKEQVEFLEELARQALPTLIGILIQTENIQMQNDAILGRKIMNEDPEKMKHISPFKPIRK